jgi:hypothetical protein
MVSDSVKKVNQVRNNLSAVSFAKNKACCVPQLLTKSTMSNHNAAIPHKHHPSSFMLPHLVN